MNIEVITEFGSDSALVDDNNEIYMDHLSSEAVEGITNALKTAGYKAHIFGGIPELTLAYANKKEIDKDALYFNISNGMTQPSRRMQAPILCEMLGLYYSGSVPTTVGLMNNKYFTKKVVKDIVKVPEGKFIYSQERLKDKLNTINKYPVIVKPNSEGGSYGIYQSNVVYNNGELLNKTYELMESYLEVLLEEVIPGTEITNLIIGNEGEYLLNEIVVYKTYGKFEHNSLVRDIKIKAENISEIYPICEYTNNSEYIDYIKETSISVFEKLRCNDIARIDYKIDLNGDLVFLEINSNPNLYAKYINVICKSKNITYPELLSLIIKAACRRYRL